MLLLQVLLLTHGIKNLDRRVTKKKELDLPAQDKSLTPKILKSAREEFLKKGFLNATLRGIAHNAAVSKGAIFRRYKTKEELFEIVVQPALDLLNVVISEEYGSYSEKREEQTLDEFFDFSLDISKDMLQLFYTESDTFKLLFAKAEGTKYENFLYDFIGKHAEESFKFMKKEEKKGVLKITTTLEEYRILLISYWSVIAGVFIRNFTLNQALSFVEKFDKFFNWQTVVEFKR